MRRPPTLLPRTNETLLLALYPLTLLFGSLFSIINPTTYLTYTSATSTSPPPSYFARKQNIFNVFFVKVGWFWTTLAFLVSFLLARSRTSPQKPLIRYLLVTAYWISITQWFFGPPLIDRWFTFSGGVCEADGTLKASAACKAIGGRWKGGHDLSGHVFLLVLSSAFLAFEAILPEISHRQRQDPNFLSSVSSISTPSDSPARTGPAAAAGQRTSARKPSPKPRAPLGIGFKIVAGVTFLDWVMLLMTATYFHTWLEKFTGLVVALVGLFTVYFLPRVVPALEQIVGGPGI
ncbi:MAG: hypothetical protein M1833_000620 [Piccolia ochrophora]|nr:MAG: hypothetical protein M1833_000620 [Piccolia ochrophora]